MSTINIPPDRAWRDYIKAAAASGGWMEDSRKISDVLGLSKRELFSLILLAHLRNHQHNNSKWTVSYDPSASEPNDGFVSDGTVKEAVEHKLVPQMAKEPVLEGILSTYAKYAVKGKAYGSNRLLVIHPNQASTGLVRVSSLRDEIQDDCPFEQVLLVACVKMRETVAIMHITEHYPGTGIAQLDFDLSSGLAAVPHCTIDL